MAQVEAAVKTGFYSAIGLFFEYDTPKIVHIKSKKVGIINRLIQLIIFAYIFGYAIYYKKGYQEFEDVESAATTKLKGVAYTNLSLHIPEISGRIWDVADYVIPPQENDAFFVMTNAIITRHQTQGTCQEDPSMIDVNCTKDSDCPVGEPVANGNGVRTGKCVPNNMTQTPEKVCEIHAWCPVEVDELPIPGQALLKDSKRFTVLIKNAIEFPKFEKKRRNILETQNTTYLSHCRFNKDDADDRLCPIFQLGTIVEDAGEDYDNISVNGGVLAIKIHWDCDLDYDISNCKPEYTFSRLDDKKDKIAKGWNFRYANYYYVDGEEQRDLIKAYGLRFVIHVTGQAGKFGIFPLLLNIGSGIGLLAIATVLCDIVTLYILKKGSFYKEKKYQYVEGDDAFQAFRAAYDDGDSDNERNTPQPDVSGVEDGSVNRSREKPGDGTSESGALGTVNNPGDGTIDDEDNFTFKVEGAAADDGVKNRKVGQYDRLQEDE